MSSGLRSCALALAVVFASGCTAQVPAVPSATARASNSVSTASASPVASTPARTAPLKLDSVSNFRDVAGDGLALPAGHRMATGVVYRSARLTGMSAADRRALAAAGITEILDLRTPGVAAALPDPEIPGARNVLINLYAVNSVPVPRLRTVADARAYMRSIDVGFVVTPAQRQRVARTLTLIARASGPVLVHCTEGKDRTGWIAAVLQLTAGARVEQVQQEYLKSNEYRADIITASYRATKAASGVGAAQIQQAQLKVDASYLNAGLAELTRRYGSIDGYLSRGLNLSKATIAALRKRLLA